MLRQLSLLADKVVDELGSIGVVLADVMVVDGLLGKPSAGDEGVDCGGRRVGRPEKGLAVDLANDPPVDLDNGIRANHLQVEDQPTRPYCLDHVAQDVHDVLGLDSSE